MDSNKELVRERREAYEYIRSTFCSRIGIPANVSDTELADKLGGKFGLKDSLKALREGRANPTAQLVEAFKALFMPVIAESEIDAHLVIPFQNA